MNKDEQLKLAKETLLEAKVRRYEKALKKITGDKGTLWDVEAVAKAALEEQPAKSDLCLINRKKIEEMVAASKRGEMPNLIVAEDLLSALVPDVSKK